jgi:hypothetical protein
MSLLFTLTIASIAGYLKMTLTEEVEALFAGLVGCFCIILGIICAPWILKLALLTALIPLSRIYS